MAKKETVARNEESALLKGTLPSARNRKKLTETELKYIRDRDNEIVRGIFRFFEVPGGTMVFPFLKNKGNDVETYSLTDGEIYQVPREVAFHLSNNCWYPQSSYSVDESGKPLALIQKKIRRCAFEPLDFLDTKSLYELTASNIEVVTPLAKG